MVEGYTHQARHSLPRLHTSSFRVNHPIKSSCISQKASTPKSTSSIKLLPIYYVPMESYFYCCSLPAKKRRIFIFHPKGKASRPSKQSVSSVRPARVAKKSCNVEKSKQASRSTRFSPGYLSRKNQKSGILSAAFASIAEPVLLLM